MTTLNLQETATLAANKSLPKVPELIQHYLDLEEKSGKGSHFHIRVEGKSNPVDGHGIAYSNALIIERDGKEVYRTRFMEYRGAYASDIDNKDNSLSDVAILEESEDEVIYALRTGAGNIKVYRFRDSSPKLLEAFDNRRYRAEKEQIELLQSVLDDPKAFYSYLREGLGNRWSLSSHAKKFNGDDIIIVASFHHDRDADAIYDRYQLHFWVKGRGFVSTKTLSTGIRHPSGRWYTCWFGYQVEVLNQDDTSVEFEIKLEGWPVGQGGQWGQPIYNVKKWHDSHTFRIEWEKAEIAL